MRLPKVAFLPDFRGQTPRPSPISRNPGLFPSSQPLGRIAGPRLQEPSQCVVAAGPSSASPLSEPGLLLRSAPCPLDRRPSRFRRLDLPRLDHVPDDGEEMAGDLSRYRVGTYGAGALWCIRRQGTLLMLFNDTPIARRAKNATADKSWMALDSAWSVKSLGGSEVLVQHNRSEGVIVSLRGGNQ
jgi:hypothetical protein